jgi:hypothetical protein
MYLLRNAGAEATPTASLASCVVRRTARASLRLTEDARSLALARRSRGRGDGRRAAGVRDGGSRAGQRSRGARGMAAAWHRRSTPARGVRDVPGPGHRERETERRSGQPNGRHAPVRTGGDAPAAQMADGGEDHDLGQRRIDSTTDPRTNVAAQVAARKLPPRSALPRAPCCPTTHTWNTTTIARKHP